MSDYHERSFMDQYPLSPRKPLKKTLTQFPFIAVFCIFLVHPAMMLLESKISISSTGSILITSAIFLIIVALIYLYEQWYFRTYFYNLTDRLIIIRKGPIASGEITISFDRIQDIYVDQDALDRLFNIYDVHISTATAASGFRAHIDGVEKGTAERLRALFLKKVEESHNK